MSALSVRVTRKDAGGRTILSGLSLAVAPGQFVALTGPSGCGKTTLIRIMAGLDADFHGTVTRDGRMGVVFQEPCLLPWRSVADNIRLAAPTADVAGLLGAVGLAGLESAFPNHLSLGMARRVAVVRALAVEPEILLLDEAFVSLDAETGQVVRDCVSAYWRRNRPSVVMVTHDLADATMVDRVVRLDAGGQVVADYTTGAPYPNEYGTGPVKATVSPSSIS